MLAVLSFKKAVQQMSSKSNTQAGYLQIMTTYFTVIKVCLLWLATYTRIRRYSLNVNKKMWAYRQSTGATLLWTKFNSSHSCTWCCTELDIWLVIKSFSCLLLAKQSSCRRTTAKQVFWESSTESVAQTQITGTL